MKPPPAPPKPIISSSPGRAEKLPTPGLARLLRGKSGSRSRARSSPMFLSKTKSLGRSSSSMKPAEEVGEPTSPKVTCIGQVRIRRKSKQKHHDSKPQHKLKPPTNIQYCCCRLSIWRKWGKKFRSEVKELDVSEPLQKLESDSEEKIEDDEEEGEDEGETTGFVSSSTAAAAVPKNALLLMRCRSAPHNRSSGLAMARFAVSPLPETPKKEEEVEGSGGSEDVKRKLSDGSSTEGEAASYGYLRPVALTRSKSQPVKTKVEMEVSYGHRNGSAVVDC